MAQATIPTVTPELEKLAIDTVRVLSMDAVQQADSGHPGTPMALAPLAYLIWTHHLRHDPADPQWPDRDRFVLSCGHASMLLYSLLHLTGYDLSLDDIREFRQWGSRTPGHPEYGYTPGVETTTGPLGQGLATAVGMAVAEAHLAARFNRDGHTVVDHHTWFVASDGDMMEGISHEAASYAGHLKLGKLIGFYDENHITIEGDTDLTFSDDTLGRFESYGWHVQRVADGNDLAALDAAIEAAKAETERPSLVIVRTHIAYGSPNKVDTPESHGSPLGAEEIRLTKENLGYPSQEPFFIADEALAHWRETRARGAELHEEWKGRWDRYAAAEPDLARELERRLKGELPAGWEDALPAFTKDNGAVASRAASGTVLNALAKVVPELVGGSADLAGSNNTMLKGEESMLPGNLGGRNMHFGIREHGMGAVMNGMALHGGFIPYGGTFLVFADYMRPAIRLAALMHQRVVYVFTHDSIGLGEDGPTHQPEEHLAALRAIPDLLVFRPADAVETAECWQLALENDRRPSVLALTRQNLPTVRTHHEDANLSGRGAYELAAGRDDAEVTLFASGSEVEIALAAKKIIDAAGHSARVVSVPSFELFAEQSEDYQAEIIGVAPVRVAIEAAIRMGWDRFIGEDGIFIGMRAFGASGPYEKLYEKFGITAEAAAKAALDRLAQRD